MFLSRPSASFSYSNSMLIGGYLQTWHIIDTGVDTLVSNTKYCRHLVHLKVSKLSYPCWDSEYWHRRYHFGGCMNWFTLNGFFTEFDFVIRIKLYALSSTAVWKYFRPSIHLYHDFVLTESVISGLLILRLISSFCLIFIGDWKDCQLPLTYPLI